MRPFAALAIAAISAAAVPTDRHPGVYQFADVSPEYCHQQMVRQQALPVHPQRLGALPPAYLIQLNVAAAPKQGSCVRLWRVR